MNDLAAHHIPPHGDVVIHAPAEGWSWRYYERAIHEFTRVRGRAPRRITMHPETLDAIFPPNHGESTELACPELTVTEQPGAPDSPGDTETTSPVLSLTTSHDHDRNTIVMG